MPCCCDSKADHLRRLAELELQDMRTQEDTRMAMTLKQPQVDQAFQSFRASTEHAFDRLPPTDRALLLRALSHAHTLVYSPILTTPWCALAVVLVHSPAPPLRAEVRHVLQRGAAAAAACVRNRGAGVHSRKRGAASTAAGPA